MVNFRGRWENWLGVALIILGLIFLYNAVLALVPVLFAFALFYAGYRFITEEKFEVSDVTRDAHHAWVWVKNTFIRLWNKSKEENKE